MTDISMQTTTVGPYERRHPWGDRPEGLPISGAVWDQAKTPGSETSTFVIKALYEAVKQLETELSASRTGLTAWIGEASSLRAPQAPRPGDWCLGSPRHTP